MRSLLVLALIVNMTGSLDSRQCIFYKNKPTIKRVQVRSNDMNDNNCMTTCEKKQNCILWQNVQTRCRLQIVSNKPNKNVDFGINYCDKNGTSGDAPNCNLIMDSNLIPILKNVNQLDISSSKQCMESCKSIGNCLLWQFDGSGMRCMLTTLESKKSNGKKGSFSATYCKKGENFLAIPGQGPCGGMEWTLNENTGICYQVVMKLQNWVNSALTCNSLGGSLANLKTADDNLFVQNLVRSINESIFSFGFWVGANDIDQKPFNFYWMDGTNMDYTDWGNGEPNNWGGVEHCVQIKVADDLKWNDIYCTKQLPSVCQKSEEKSIDKPKNYSSRDYN